MGLEAINFYFTSKKLIKNIIESNALIVKIDEKHYVYKKDNFFWIDIELQNDLCISIRITLCNPNDSVLKALDDLFLYLFSFESGKIYNLHTKETFNEYNELTKVKILESYINRKIVFNKIYGDYTAAISSEEFYKNKRNSR